MKGMSELIVLTGGLFYVATYIYQEVIARWQDSNTS